MLQKILLLFLVYNVSSSALMACSCSRGARLVSREIQRSNLVFTGKVLRIKKIDSDLEYREVHILVKEWFKGKTRKKKLVIYTGAGRGDCGFYFKKKQSYIIYTNKDARLCFNNERGLSPKLENTNWTDICTRTKLINSIELLELRKHQE